MTKSYEYYVRVPRWAFVFIFVGFLLVTIVLVGNALGKRPHGQDVTGTIEWLQSTVQNDTDTAVIKLLNDPTLYVCEDVRCATFVYGDIIQLKCIVSAGKYGSTEKMHTCVFNGAQPSPRPTFSDDQ